MADSNLSPISAYVNSFKIEVVHVPSNKQVKFGAFLSSFNDSYKTNFKSQTVYGRMDPIVNYQNTTRTLSIGFILPAASEQEAKDNLEKMSSLVKFQYPEYDSVENVSGISAPPICKLKFQNLANEYGDYLYGFFGGVDFSPTNEAGYFIDDAHNLYPKEYKVSLTFTVLHTKAVGWFKNEWANGEYPYKNSTKSPTQSGNPASATAAAATPETDKPFDTFAKSIIGK